jgi:glucose-1-phosphate cytidylyltransferase
MQVVILAGGFGTRLSEETDKLPKPMVTIGEIPILLHIMSYYASFGHKHFTIALGYKGEVIKDFFKNLSLRNSDLSINLENGNVEILRATKSMDWKVDLIDTGLHTQTGGRILKLEKFLDDTFMLTYGDGLSNVNLDELLEHHRKGRKTVTVTAVRPPARFGSLLMDGDLVTSFSEKKPQDAGWINGGYFCMTKNILKMIDDESYSLESLPMEKLVSKSELNAYRHEGFWQGMDTIRDRQLLEELWQSENAPWSTKERML